MPKRAVTLDVYAEVIITVDADTDEQAVEIAREMIGNPPCLCHHCEQKISIGDWVGTGSVKLVQ
jgi:hypothetical protein